ncbi:Bug family tripartite tricarboxylate transporter substrate binding protein [Aquabacterium sp.]|uniref:Bug family tripartite tricarboxylate transporter substrate binding protein n=1 Tax=Aquabacterium sp. TaxID=1872578 RepID=UPI002B8A1775|nr:tripartite tricarboxylate transporter substrate binding protein [Aquabacterium sp.]HSV71753.1 tripartite tricarboxylate transporter substrate binding protein [Methylibium sp.]HSW08084.1 tripartite tricarboxylate transporter substrate binding protein [Aquabacterium sp.]
MTIARLVAAVSFCAVLSQPALADNFPAKPITLVIGSSAGSTTDGLARAIGQEITAATKVPVIVESKAGASGGIAAQAVARAPADGYTLFITTNTTQAANPHLFRKLAYDPVKDFTPVGALVKGYLLLVTHPNVKAHNVAELIAFAKTKPLTFGAGSSSARVASELFQQMTQTQLTHVPYKANPPAIVDLVGGQIDVMIVDLTTSLPQVKAGKLKALGVSSPMRSPLAPELPTIAEAGLPGYEMSYWNAVYAPAGTPAPIVQRINELMQRALATDSVRRFVEQNGMEPFTSTPAELASFQAAEYKRWGSVIKAAGIAPE